MPDTPHPSPQITASLAQSRIDCSPENIEQGLAKLVLSLIELLRQLLERQAIRRMEGGSLTEEQVESMGEALMKLEAKIHELAAHFGLSPADLDLDLGPVSNSLEE
ncbi:MAG TPA: gas vesicle protein K [Terriglobales bacterium]|nr:gas vesicle protein K [Terriglobales bacterium]